MSVDPPYVTFTQYVVLGFLFLGLAGFFRRVSLSGKANWDKSFQPIDPSLKASASPMSSVKSAVTGIFTWLLCWVMVIWMFWLAVDYLFFEGSMSAAFFDNVTSALGF